MEDSPRILHVITGTDSGGAQVVLHQLLKADRSDNASVLSMATPGYFGPMLEELGTEVRTLGMSVGHRPSAANLLGLRRTMRELDPSLVQGWMYHGNIAAFVAARALWQAKPVIWGIHHTIMKLEKEKRMTRAIIRLSARLSRFTDAIIYCSKQSASDHERLGFDAKKTVVIPNGIDCDKFRPDREAGARLRQQLGIPKARRIIGFVARFHPMKDHRNLIAAAKRLLDQSRSIHVVLIGAGSESEDLSLKSYVADCGIGDHVTFMGQRKDVTSIVPGFDVFCLPSAWGEAFPLVVCEAMACGVPCVVTDVGDSAWIVGDTGFVVPRQDSDALSNALRSMFDLGDEAMMELGDAARRRISTEFPLTKMAASYRDCAFCLIATTDSVQRRPGSWNR